MIIARSPLRITLGGGGTDLPTYYERKGGALLSAAIDRYVYVAVHPTFLPHWLIRYSQIETVEHPRDVKHPILREALDLLQVSPRPLEITTMADIPAGTGLGSSGSFGTALLKALLRHQRKVVQPAELAAMAAHIEIDRLKEPVGKQDQYIAAFGGVTWFEFHPDGRVDASPAALPDDTLRQLEERLLLFSTGIRRSASAILDEQDKKTKQGDTDMIANLDKVKQIGLDSRQALERGDLGAFGEMLHHHWQEKKKRSGQMTNPEIDHWYDEARRAGALGGKLIGAGGGGFLMFLAEDPSPLRAAMQKLGLDELRFRFDYEGTRLL